MAQLQPITRIALQAMDASGQKVINVPSVPVNYTVGELTKALLVKMQLPDNVPYQVRLERQQRHLHASETVEDALETGDKVVIHPSIDAGGC